MDQLILFLSWFIGFIFISASYRHSINKTDFKIAIEEYGLLPQKYINGSLYIIMFIEYGIGLFMFLGIFLRITYSLGFLLVFLFTIAILINLFRNNSNIDCGCGGVLGTHKISWRLVGRNCFILIIISYLFVTNNIYGGLLEIISGNYNAINIYLFLVVKSLIAIFTLYLTFTKINSIKAKLDSFLHTL